MTLLDSTTLPASHDVPETHRTLTGGHPLPTDHSRRDSHTRHVGGDDLDLHIGNGHFAPHRSRADVHSCPPAILIASPTGPPLAGTLLFTGHNTDETQRCDARGDLPGTDQPLRATAIPASSAPPSSTPPTPPRSIPAAIPAPPAWAELRIAADLFNRAQLERIGVSNIMRAPADGGNVQPQWFASYLDRLAATEHEARLIMVRTMRRVVPPELRAWQKQEVGIGEPLFARLLGRIGDPYIAVPHWWEGSGANRVLMVGDPYVRTIAQLWQYCGHGDPHRRPERGMNADDLAALGSPPAKMLVHLNAECCMKAKGHYREVYETVRTTVADKVHTVECRRCGPSGKPAQPGSPWSPGHQHAHALRIVGKEILRNMWTVRRDAVENAAALA